MLRGGLSLSLSVALRRFRALRSCCVSSRKHTQALGLSVDHGSVDVETLVSLIANQLFECSARGAGGDDEAAAALRGALDDAIALLPGLSKGLDVNVRFAGSTLFEFTDCLGLFDLLDVQLVHGWLVDPEDHQTAQVLGQRTYNELVETLVCAKSVETQADGDRGETQDTALVRAESSGGGGDDAGDDDGCGGGDGGGDGDGGGGGSGEGGTGEGGTGGGSGGSCETLDEAAARVAREGAVIEAFLAQSATQLTYFGLARLGVLLWCGVVLRVVPSLSRKCLWCS